MFAFRPARFTREPVRAGASPRRANYTYLGNGSNGEFFDTRPFPAKPQKRRYYAFFVKDTAGQEEIDLPSDMAKILVQKAG